MTSQFFDRTSIFFDVVLFFLSSLFTGPSFMSVPSLGLELWQFSFIRNWPEIRKLEIAPSEFFPISGDWSKFSIQNLAQMSLIKCYWMLQTFRVTAFTVCELLSDNQLWGWGRITPAPPPHTLIRVKGFYEFFYYIYKMSECNSIDSANLISNLLSKKPRRDTK